MRRSDADWGAVDGCQEFGEIAPRGTRGGAGGADSASVAQPRLTAAGAIETTSPNRGP